MAKGKPKSPKNKSELRRSPRLRQIVTICPNIEDESETREVCDCDDSDGDGATQANTSCVSTVVQSNSNSCKENKESTSSINLRNSASLNVTSCELSSPDGNCSVSRKNGAETESTLSIVDLSPASGDSCHSSDTVFGNSPDSVPGTSHFSPNTELLSSNIDLSADSSNITYVPASHNDEPNSEQSLVPDLGLTRRALNSLRAANSSIRSRAISLRNRPRRPVAQSRAIMSAYRSIPSSLPVKGESYCDCPKTSRDLTCGCGEEDSAFEWRWDSTGKSSACNLSDENRTAIFHVSYSSGTAAVRGSQPMTDRQYFWEVKMTSPVYGTDMMVGIGTDSVNLDCFRHTFTSLLGRDGDSWGLSYYGRLQQKGQFTPIAGAKFGQGSIIGLHLDMWQGTLSYYKNRKPLGVLCSGLHGKTLYPMVSSTAARTTMKIVKACSFPSSLQFSCCQALRKMVPQYMDVREVVSLPPGLRAFLENNLSWLLRPSELDEEEEEREARKRRHSEMEGSELSSEGDESREAGPSKRFCFGTTRDLSDASDDDSTVAIPSNSPTSAHA